MENKYGIKMNVPMINAKATVIDLTPEEVEKSDYESMVSSPPDMLVKLKLFRFSLLRRKIKKLVYEGSVTDVILSDMSGSEIVSGRMLFCGFLGGWFSSEIRLKASGPLSNNKPSR